MIQVKRKPNETSEELLKRFIKVYKKSDELTEYKKHTYFLSKGEKKRKEEKKLRKKWLKNQKYNR